MPKTKQLPPPQETSIRTLTTPDTGLPQSEGQPSECQAPTEPLAVNDVSTAAAVETSQAPAAAPSDQQLDNTQLQEKEQADDKGNQSPVSR